jgi:hypothetical protein
MYQIPSRRRQTIMRVAVYSVMTLAVITLVTVLVFVMLGYRFNNVTSQIQQGGLVQFASRPDGASVTIGSAKLGATTPTKITVGPRQYDVTMAKKGYLNWKKNVDVKAGEVLWLNYAQLVPQKIETKQMTRFDTVADVKSSPNGDRFAVIQDAAKPTLTFVDVTGSQPKSTTIELPVELLPTDKPFRISLGDWANDSDRMVVNLSYDSTVEHLLVDRRDAAKTINLSKTYLSDITDIVFDPRSSEKLIVRNSRGDLRTIDTSENSLSGIVATNVTDMAIYENDAVLLVQTTPDGAQQVGYLSLGSDKTRVLKRISSKDKVLVGAADYFSDPHLAVSVGNQLEVYKLSTLPSSESDSSISMTRLSATTLPATADFLSIRASGRFVVAQYAGGEMTYDVELSRQSVTAFSTPNPTELRWLDRYHFYLTNGRSLEVMEFDGANAHQITTLSTGFDAVQSNDGTFIYTINAVDNGYAIQQSRMILK